MLRSYSETVKEMAEIVGGTHTTHVKGMLRYGTSRMSANLNTGGPRRVGL